MAHHTTLAVILLFVTKVSCCAYNSYRPSNPYIESSYHLNDEWYADEAEKYGVTEADLHTWNWRASNLSPRHHYLLALEEIAVDIGFTKFRQKNHSFSLAIIVNDVFPVNGVELLRKARETLEIFKTKGPEADAKLLSSFYPPQLLASIAAKDSGGLIGKVMLQRLADSSPLLYVFKNIRQKPTFFYKVESTKHQDASESNIDSNFHQLEDIAKKYSVVYHDHRE